MQQLISSRASVVAVSALLAVVLLTGAGSKKTDGDLPPSSVNQDEIGPFFMHTILLCGQLADSGTLYVTPATGFGAGNGHNYGAANDDFKIGGAGCDAMDNATEATADAVMYANTAFKVVGLFCQVSSSGSNGVTLNLRSATANLTPDITLTIPTAETTAAVSKATSVDIAAGATFALKTVTTENLSAQDAWCLANIVLQP